MEETSDRKANLWYITLLHSPLHPEGFFRFEGQCGKRRYLSKTGWRQMPKLRTWMRAPSLGGKILWIGIMGIVKVSWAQVWITWECLCLTPGFMWHQWIMRPQVCMRVKLPGEGSQDSIVGCISDERWNVFKQGKKSNCFLLNLPRLSSFLISHFVKVT